MIISIPVTTSNMEGKVSSHFGRTEYFLFFDTESGKEEFLPNLAVSSPGGAGIKAAQLLVRNKVEALISPPLGENAAQVIKEAGISVYLASHESILDTIEAFKSGKLELSRKTHPGLHGRVQGQGPLKE